MHEIDQGVGGRATHSSVFAIWLLHALFVTTRARVSEFFGLSFKVLVFTRIIRSHSMKNLDFHS